MVGFVLSGSKPLTNLLFLEHLRTTAPDRETTMRVIIMQGTPGSGKSTEASGFGPDATIVSADHYFEDPITGEYRFNPAKLGEAHASCMRSFLRACEDASAASVIVVDNTNITIDQMSPYYLVARAYKASVEVRRVACDPEVAAARNSHGVPRETVLRMARMMQDPPKFWDCTFVKTDSER